MAQIGALQMIRLDLVFIYWKLHRGIPGLLSDPKHFGHEPAKPLARSPQVEQQADKDTDNRLPDERTQARINIRQNMHDLVKLCKTSP
jgi:hypothetical protein